jgi:hypothetical protein
MGVSTRKCRRLRRSWRPLVYKPRRHTFWNATEEPARLLEIISPAGFEQFFVELAALRELAPEDIESVAALHARYGVEVDPSSVDRPR